MPAPEGKSYRLKRAGVFYPRGAKSVALSWHANGLYYGVGIEIDLCCTPDSTSWLTAHAPTCRRRGALSIGAAAHLFTGFAGDPAQRLENRGRENASEINARLARPPAILLRIAIHSIMTAACAIGRHAAVADSSEGETPCLLVTSPGNAVRHRRGLRADL